MQAKQVLHKLLLKLCPEMHSLRRRALFANVMAALSGKVLTVTGLGRSIQSEAKEKHCIKRADRLLSNVHLHGERAGIYSAITAQLIGSKHRPVIIVDWSDMDESKRHFLLRASVPVQGRSLTLYEEVHTLKTKEKPKTHKRFLERLKTRVPADCRPILVTDAGFRTPWFKEVEALGWDWVGRIRIVMRCNSQVKKRGSPPSSYILKPREDPRRSAKPNSRGATPSPAGWWSIKANAKVGLH